MRTKIGSLAVFIVLSLGMQAQAATLDVIANINVTHNGPTVSQGGTIDQFGTLANSSDDWGLNILPPGQSTTLVAIHVGTTTGTVTGLEIYEVTGVGVGTLIASALGSGVTVQAALDGAKKYVLRVSGIVTQSASTSYLVDINAVPLPAAALLFLSGLAGFGLLGRRKKGSTDSDMPLLAA